MLRAIRLLSVILATITACAAQQHPVAPALQTIHDARKLSPGSAVTVRGIVTMPSGVMGARFAIQQGDSGIYVAAANTGVYVVRDELQVTGELFEKDGLLAIEPRSITRISGGSGIDAYATSTGTVGESTEGRLLHLQGTLVGYVVDDSPYGYKMNIDDGSGPALIFLYPVIKAARLNLRRGMHVEVDCISSQYQDHYECAPTNATDLIVTR